MARKKIVLVIVEGPSDDVALGMALSQVYDKDFIYVYIMHGDITTRRGVNSQNIVAKIGSDVTAYANHNIIKQVILSKLFILLIQMEPIFRMIKSWKKRTA